MMLAFICAPGDGSAKKRAAGGRTLSVKRHAPCATFPRTAARPWRRTRRTRPRRPGAAARRRSCALQARQRQIGLPHGTRVSRRSSSGLGRAGAHVSVMSLASASGGTSADATAAERRAARQQLRGASALRAGASGAATSAASMDPLTIRCGAAELRAGAEARARATPRTRHAAVAAGRAAVSAILTFCACCWHWVDDGKGRMLVGPGGGVKDVHASSSAGWSRLERA